MRKLILIGVVSALFSPQLWAAANCLHSHSWQCQGHHGNSGQGSQVNGGIATGGHTPDTSTTNPHLGTTGGNNQNPVAMVPAQLIQPAIAVPPRQPVAVPGQVPTATPPKQPMAKPHLVPQPMNVPGKVPTAIPPKQPMAKPHLVPQPMNVPGQVPTAIPPKQPMAKPHLVPQPMNVPGQVPTAIPPKQPMAKPHLVPQPMNVPGQVPTAIPPKQPMAKPHLVPQVVPPRPLVITPHPNHVHFQRPVAVTGTTPATGTTAGRPTIHPIQVPHRPSVKPGVPHVVTVPGKTTPEVIHTQLPGQQTTHHIMPTVVRQPARISGAGELWVSEVVEPGIQNRRVELYRSNDAEEVLYQDVIPMDKTGFHLTVIGIRPPNYGVSQ